LVIRKVVERHVLENSHGPVGIDPGQGPERMVAGPFLLDRQPGFEPWHLLAVVEDPDANH
jgi:hypothetical protein